MNMTRAGRMSNLDRSKPHIEMERGTNGTHAIRFHLGDGRYAGVVIDQTSENADIIDYFYERLKDGVNL
ncbi:hypothetical protein [Bradyrhizobium sp. SZCCHNR1075]|uniref:hypothetical protein n=1 Tax=Bradyrhizobium sp. SZCCHNR1075 TaxID=3057362 RepID=UPI0028E3287C|nr:hypothetical protein [Bradyrhizobium sp. SZCCHNR1075]